MYLFLLTCNAALSPHTVKWGVTALAEKAVKVLKNHVCYVSLALSYLSVAIEQVTICGRVSSVESWQKSSKLSEFKNKACTSSFSWSLHLHIRNDEGMFFTQSAINQA